MNGMLNTARRALASWALSTIVSGDVAPVQARTGHDTNNTARA